MKKPVEFVRKYFPECTHSCNCATKLGESNVMYDVRLHLSTPTGNVVQAVDVTCDCCGKSAYADVTERGITRDELVL